MAVASSAPFEYPTPAMLADYTARTQRLQAGTMTPLYAPQLPPATSNLGAPTGSPRKVPGRFRQALAIMILGADAGNVLFPPQQPLQPVAQPPEMGALGRPWDYPVGWNTRVTPRTGVRIGFPFLKSLAEYDLLRIMIERVKDSIVTQGWMVGPKDKKKPRDSRCDQLEDLFAYPDGVHTWDDWIRMVLEQALVYDALAIWLRPDYNGDLVGLEIMDGSRFTPKIMADGRIPPPEYGPAYQQVLHGLPAVDYIQPVPKGRPVPLDPDGEPFPELLYKPRNPRIDIPYGYGPVEQIIRTVEIGLRREEFFLDFYTLGSTPDMMVGTPEGWNPDQISQFQGFWDTLMQGNLGNRRGVRFVPGKMDVHDIKEGALTDQTDEWLARIMCFALGLSPSAFTKMQNRATAQQHAEQQKEEGLLPYLGYIAGIFNHIIGLKFGWRDIVFRWEEEVETDPLQEAQRFSLYLTNKVYNPDEVRMKLGEDAMSEEMRSQMDMPTFSNSPTATVLPPDQQDEEDARNQQAAEQKAKLTPPPVIAAPGTAPPAAAPGGGGKAMGKGRLAKLANRSVRSGLPY